MFCLMDVSGSMTEHMKDLAKRFYMLLYVFLKRRYKHVEIVFIRHTAPGGGGRRGDVLPQPETGGTLVSTRAEEMQRDRRASAIARRTGTSTPRRPPTATTPTPTTSTTARAADRDDPAGLPVLRLSRGRREAERPAGFDLRAIRRSGTPTSALRNERRTAVDAQGQPPPRDLSGVPRPVPAPRRRRGAEAA